MGLFRDKTASNKVDTPRPVGRDSEVRSALSEFKQSALNVTPATAIIYGLRKSGKSAILRDICNSLMELADEQDIDIKILCIDCEFLANRRELFFEVLREQRHEKSQNINPEKRKYVTYKWLTSQIKYQVENREADFYIFALDNIDTIEESVKSLEDLICMNKEYGEPSVGFISTSSKSPLIDNSHLLSRKLLTSKINLSYPDDVDYRRILEANIEVGFKNNSITDDAFQRLFEWSYGCVQIGEAIEILFQAGERANEEASDQVTEQHIEQAIEDFNMTCGVRWILDRKFDIHNQGILLALANSDKKPIRTKQLYHKYEYIFENLDSGPLSYRQFCSRILRKEFLNPFISTEKKDTGSDGGVYYELKLNAEPNLIYTALTHESYQELPKSHLPNSDASQFLNLAMAKMDI